MLEEEFSNLCYRFGRLLTLHNQLYIGQLTNEINSLEAMWRDSQQRHKRLEKMLTESYSENRKLSDRLYSLFDKTWRQPGSDTTTSESAHRNSTRRPNTNECVETWDDVLAFLIENSNLRKRQEQAVVNEQSEVGQESLDPADRQVVSEKKETEQVLSNSLVFASLIIFVRFEFLFFDDETLALYTTTITRSLYNINSFSSLHSHSRFIQEKFFTFFLFARCTGAGRVEWRASSRKRTGGSHDSRNYHHIVTIHSTETTSLEATLWNHHHGTVYSRRSHHRNWSYS